MQILYHTIAGMWSYIVWPHTILCRCGFTHFRGGAWGRYGHELNVCLPYWLIWALDQDCKTVSGFSLGLLSICALLALDAHQWLLFLAVLVAEDLVSASCSFRKNSSSGSAVLRTFSDVEKILRQKRGSKIVKKWIRIFLKWIEILFGPLCTIYLDSSDFQLRPKIWYYAKNFMSSRHKWAIFPILSLEICSLTFIFFYFKMFLKSH